MTDGAWKAPGCALTTYNGPMVNKCFKSESLYFVGDSVGRNIFKSIGNRFASLEDGVKEHEDIHLDLDGNGTAKFLWDPFLNGTDLRDILVNQALDRPTYIFVSAGPWFMK
jgi:hypothetical protein